MFSTLGLFTAACPDTNCRRISCFFKHGPSSSTSASRPTMMETPEKKSVVGKRKPDSGGLNASVSAVAHAMASNHEREVDKAERLKTDSAPDASAVAPKKARVIPDGKGTPTSVVRNASTNTRKHEANRKSTSSTASDVVPDTAAQPARRILDISRPPLVPRQKGLSPQPYVDRQKALTTLYQQYAKLYTAIIHLSPELAHKSSIEQEADTSSSSANIRAYKTAIHHAAVNISRRPIPDTLDHPSVGTVKESRVATEKVERARASRPTRDRIAGYCLPLDDLLDWGYPDPKDKSLTIGGGQTPSAEGTTQECTRCKSNFVVTPKSQADPHGCKYHYGKTAPERVEGRRKWIYSCCGRERGEAGCQDGVHVFTEKEDDHKLKARVGFRTVRQVVDNVRRPKGWVDVVAMDCEMIYTTSGSSLARITVVDEEGAVLFDELVRQTASVLDLNSRFSGVNEGDLDKAVMDLTGAREAACMFIGPDTIIVGHGLENDLRALRLVHNKIIDTAILFPHDKGRPFRRALRDIVKEKLGYFIQDRTSDLGHSSAEDAKATLECLKWKVRDDADDRVRDSGSLSVRG